MNRIAFQSFMLVIFVLLFTRCENEQLRKTDKFSYTKKYAVLPFSCKDKDMSLKLSESLRDWLVTFDYDIIEQEKLDELLAQSGLNAEEIVDNYAIALNKIKGIDGIIIGRVLVDKKAEQNSSGISGGAGGSKHFISGCEVYVIDLKSGDILARGDYEAPTSSEMYGSLKPDEIGKKLAIKLSPH